MIQGRPTLNRTIQTDKCISTDHMHLHIDISVSSTHMNAVSSVEYSQSANGHCGGWYRSRLAATVSKPSVLRDAARTTGVAEIRGRN